MHEAPRGQWAHDVDDTLKYSSSLQSSGFLRLRSRQTAEPLTFIFPSSTASHPVGHFSHFKLGSFSCGWNHALGQLEHSFDPSDDAYFPFAQFMHETEPPKLVCPGGHKSHAVLFSFPLVPSLHASNDTHLSHSQGGSMLQILDPSGTEMAALPPSATTLPDSTCSQKYFSGVG